ncbi:MAG: PLP-dependent aminotransferase family protein [Oscillospiraceae bacterium]|nr:PLP-dependent aminotransferase family protein [Oscillospiraceae bacterium]
MNIPISEHMAQMNPSLIREIFKAAQQEGLISFTAGSPSAAEFPVAELSELSQKLFATKAATALSYGVTEGYTPLREAISKRLKEKYNIGTENDDLLIISGGQQCLDFTAKCLVNDGDTVIVEAPSFLNALNTYRTYGARLVGVPMGDDGMDIDALENALRTEKNVKFIYTIPNFQNPMGVTMPWDRRKRLYDLACKYDVMILEDDPYGELRYSGEPVAAIKSIDTEGRVIYTSSFSKIIAPGIRIAYLCAPKELFAKMVVAKQCVDVHSNLFFQMLVYEYITNYDLDAHIKTCCGHYAIKRDAMLSAIDRYFPKSVSVTRPQGGLFLWATLPEGFTGLEFCRYATSVGVAAVPGAPFFPDGNPLDRGFRMNFSVPSLEQIDKGIALMGKGLHQFIEK